MTEERKKEPKVIHVDKLVIKADEVVFQPEQNNHPPFRFPGFQGAEGETPIVRDFWGFPVPRRVEEPEEGTESKQEDKE
ncbi:hypothetical protein EWI07_12650 [Sporolactobacillus sp. THM7-4]|nr:hypothetical protein EWI07_12650 [Sporolactobacillus sp. THM7-4]